MDPDERPLKLDDIAELMHVREMLAQLYCLVLEDADKATILKLISRARGKTRCIETVALSFIEEK